MKKRLMSLLLMLCVAFSLVVPVSAADTETQAVEFETIAEEEAIINDVEFLANATVTKKDLGNDTYGIELREREKPKVDSEVGEASRTSAVIVAFGEEELEKVEKSVQKATIMASTSSKTKASGWIYMGNSLYVETTINYTYNSSSGQTLYKMTSVTTKVQVRNGTTYSNRSVKFTSQMALQTGLTQTVNIPASAASTYNVPAPSSWGYVSSQGLLYVVYFYCTALRPSGESERITFYKDLFE